LKLSEADSRVIIQQGQLLIMSLLMKNQYKEL